MDPEPVTLLEGLATTRAIRRYTDDPLPEADLAEILWHAARAPSGTNRQPFRFITLRRDDPEADAARALLGRSFRASWVDKQADLDRDGRPESGSPRARMQASMQQYVDHLERTPVVVLVGLERYRSAHPYEGASVYPACQNLLLAARALGYGGALTGFHHVVEDELRQLLGVPDHVALSACITLGRPAGRHGPLRRKPLDRLVHDGRWDRPAEWLGEWGGGGGRGR
ncbi:MAG: nitroreductase family protein [Ilumatobacteraceae bacterium]